MTANYGLSRCRRHEQPPVLSEQVLVFFALDQYWTAGALALGELRPQLYLLKNYVAGSVRPSFLDIHPALWCGNCSITSSRLFYFASLWVEANSMRISIQIIDGDGNEQTIFGVKREDWDDMNDPCPECGGIKFNHFSVSGGHYGTCGSAVVMRSDFWDADQSLFTRCHECCEILYKHPAFDLIFSSNDTDKNPLNF